MQRSERRPVWLKLELRFEMSLAEWVDVRVRTLRTISRSFGTYPLTLGRTQETTVKLFFKKKVNVREKAPRKPKSCFTVNKLVSKQ